MEINIKQITKFDIGDTVYYVDIFNKKIIKGVIVDISLQHNVKKPVAMDNTYFTYFIQTDSGNIIGTFGEKFVYKTEYEAKIALANMI